MQEQTWEKTRYDLEHLGHQVSTPNLPLISLEADAQTVIQSIDGVNEPCVLVGHSYGGLVISKVAYMRSDIAHLVYVAAIMIGKDEIFVDVSADYPAQLSEHVIISDDNTFTVSTEGAKKTFYDQCPLEIATSAVTRLRPTALECLMTPSGSEPWQDVPSTYLVCSGDNAINPDLQKKMARRAQNVVTFDTDHSPFYSRREQFLELLVGIEQLK